MRLKRTFDKSSASNSRSDSLAAVAMLLGDRQLSPSAAGGASCLDRSLSAPCGAESQQAGPALSCQLTSPWRISEAAIQPGPIPTVTAVSAMPNLADPCGKGWTGDCMRTTVAVEGGL